MPRGTVLAVHLSESEEARLAPRLVRYRGFARGLDFRLGALEAPATVKRLLVWSSFDDSTVQGQQSLLVSDEGGRAGVAKVFGRRDGEASHDEALRRAEEEAALWEAAYGDKFHVAVRRINGRRPVLIMPYVPAWQGKAEEGEGGEPVFELRRVAKALLDWFHKRRLVYEDLHWRHLGQDAGEDGAVVLFDLGDVRRLRKGEGTRWIAKGVRERLWERRGDRRVVEGTEELLDAMLAEVLAPGGADRQ